MAILTNNINLKAGVIDLWFAFPDEIKDKKLISAYEKILHPQELTQQKAFYFPKHRHQYLITRALVKTTISRYTGIKPDCLKFSKNGYGRPELIPKGDIPPIRFNLSHTDGLIVCSIVLKEDIGVDVEDIARQGISIQLADRFFSKREIMDLNNLPEEKRKDRFFDYWTLKESYIKARGMGLSIPLEQFTFHIQENTPLKISFDPIMNDNPHNWQFWLFEPTQRHKAALSICQSQLNYHIAAKKVVPLLEDEDFTFEIIKQS